MAEWIKLKREKSARKSMEISHAEEVATEAVERRIFEKIKKLRKLDSYDDDYWTLSENIASDIRTLAHSALRERDFAKVTDIGRLILVAYEVREAEHVSSSTPASALAIAEACNLAAKVFAPRIFYAIKPSAIVAAWKLGAAFGKGEDNAYYLGDPVAGVASFHDPNQEIEYIVEEILHEKVPTWEYPWSGKIRYDDAFKILDSFSNDEHFLEQYAEDTLPPEMNELRKIWMRKAPEEGRRPNAGNN